MAFFETTIQTDTDVSTAFAYLSDFANAAEWDPFVAEAERVGRGAIRRGARFQVTMRSLPGQTPLRLDYTLTQFERDKRIAFTAESDAFRSHDVITFEPSDDGGCTVHYDADLRPRGAWFLFDLPLHLAFQLSGRGSAAGLQRGLDGLVAKQRPPLRRAS